jgi:hypothetical protein
MNDTISSEIGSNTTPFAPSAGRQPRRPLAARLSAAPSLALTALAAAPLAAAARIAFHFGDPQTVAVLADECDKAFASGALNTVKWPLCAGD